MSTNSLLVVTSILASAILLGCNRPPSEGQTTSPGAVAAEVNSTVPLAVADTSRPDTVVSAFLDALREGNDEIAEALLTTVARRETQRYQLAVQPPGSPSAQYQIGEVTEVQGGAHVNSVWSELDSSGAPSVYEIVWVLRNEPIGWRIAGMATSVNSAQPPVYLNFEDVPDLLHKWQQADELLEQTEPAQILQAAEPESKLMR